MQVKWQRSTWIVLFAAISMVMASCVVKAQDADHLPTFRNYFPQDIVSAYAKYNDAYSKHDFGALQSLLAPHFMFVVSNKAEPHQKSLDDLKETGNFDLPAPPPSADNAFKTSVTLYKVSKEANQATVLLSQQIVYAPMKIHGEIESGAGTFYWKQSWIKTAAGWRLFKISPLGKKPASGIYSITVHD